MEGNRINLPTLKERKKLLGLADEPGTPYPPSKHSSPVCVVYSIVCTVCKLAYIGEHCVAGVVSFVIGVMLIVCAVFICTSLAWSL